MAIYRNRGPGRIVVVDDGKLLLSPRRVAIDKVPMHHSVAMRMSFLKHSQARGPVVECALRIGVVDGLRHLYFHETIHVAVGSAVCDAFRS